MAKVEQSDPGGWVKVDAFYADGHSSFYVLDEDASITLAFGADYRDGQAWDHESWSKDFPDSKVFGYFLDVRYNGVTVNRDLILSVDGSRAYLPSGQVVGDSNAGVVGMKAFRSEARRAQLLDKLSGNHEFDSYMSRANINVTK